MSAGATHSLVLKTDGTLWGFGKMIMDNLAMNDRKSFHANANHSSTIN